MKKKKQVIIFFGMIATGKSYLASHWALRHGYPYYNSDVVRKELAGVKQKSNRREGVDQGIYSSEFSRKTYDELLRRAQADLSSSEHECVVLDGSYQSRDERDRVRSRLKDYRQLFVYCKCPESVMKARMDKREKDPEAVSDGRWEIYLKQKQRFELPSELSPELLVIVDTDKELEELLVLLDDEIRNTKHEIRNKKSK